MLKVAEAEMESSHDLIATSRLNYLRCMLLKSEDFGRLKTSTLGIRCKKT